jgi:hypothetical protein
MPDKVLARDSSREMPPRSSAAACNAGSLDGSATTHFAAGPAGRANVALEHVVHDLPVCAEAPAEGPDGALHTGDPASRQAVAITVVVARHHLVAEDLDERFSVTGVVDLGYGVGLARADRKAVRSIVGLRPPAVEDGEIQSAVKDVRRAQSARSYEGREHPPKPSAARRSRPRGVGHVTRSPDPPAATPSAGSSVQAPWRSSC